MSVTNKDIQLPVVHFKTRIQYVFDFFFLFVNDKTRESLALSWKIKLKVILNRVVYETDLLLSRHVHSFCY